MRGSSVIASACPRGHREECIISGTPLPGTCAEIVPSTIDVGGVFTYRNVTRSNGAKGPVVVFLEDRQQGKLITDAYVSGTRGFLYWPVAGEELNLLVRETVGTGTAGEENVGDLLAIEKATGELMAGGALASTPFYLLEHGGVDLGDDNLRLVKYLGNNA